MHCRYLLRITSLTNIPRNIHAATLHRQLARPPAATTDPAVVSGPGQAADLERLTLMRMSTKKTNVADRFAAWISDPGTPPEPTLQDAFTEGFAQCMEWLSGQPRHNPGQTEPPTQP